MHLKEEKPALKASEKLQAELSSILGGSSPAPKAAPAKRRLSASAKKDLWAKRMNVVSPLDALLESEKPKPKKSGAMSERTLQL